ncbi:hypothetical protein INT47_013186 [Mucor saturninus]|uniref:Uncharacterized protein n=1 Tax=Mucor saturninus TaxID=64648 RepID=A0A8H7UVL9_9FUNG|nr:hypothetical protein INT47_013186 [Mucor saturninus]
MYSYVDEKEVKYRDIVSVETMDYFENVYKPRYMQYLTDNDDGYHDFDLHTSNVSKAISKKNSVFLNNNTILRISNEEMKTCIVDPAVDPVLNILRTHYELNKDGGMSIEGIIMVGGFSQCKYLQKRIKKEYRDVCKVIYPDEPIHAFSRGAVEYALNPSNISVKYIGPSIFLEVQKPLKKYDLIQLNCLKLKGPDSKYYLKKHQQYFVKDGQKVKRKKFPYCFSQLILVEYPKSAVIAIHSSHAVLGNKRKQAKITEIRLDTYPATIGIKNGNLIEYRVLVKVFKDEAIVQISHGNHDTLFDYGSFSLRKNNFQSMIPTDELLWNVLIDNYLANFNKDARYHIDQF